MFFVVWITFTFPNIYHLSLVVNKLIFSLSFSGKVFILVRKVRKKCWRKLHISFCLHIQTCWKNYSSPMSLLCIPCSGPWAQGQMWIYACLRVPPQLFVCTLLSDRLINSKTHFAQLDLHRTSITYSCLYAALILRKHQRKLLMHRRWHPSSYCGENW